MDQGWGAKVTAARTVKATKAKPAPPDKSSAEWMAVHYANRAVTVAWVSAVVNLLVVIVALATPFFQRHIDRQKETDAQYESKSALVTQAIKIYLDGVQNKDALRPILDPDYGTDQKLDIRTRSEMIDEDDLFLANLLEENRYLFSQPNNDINYRNFVSVLVQRINDLRYTARRTKYINENRTVSGIAALRASQAQFANQYDEDLTAIRLLILRNYDPLTQKTKPGLVDYAECDDVRYKAICAEPNGVAIR
jgi:hypothetical protein